MRDECDEARLVSKDRKAKTKFTKEVKRHFFFISKNSKTPPPHCVVWQM